MRDGANRGYLSELPQHEPLLQPSIALDDESTVDPLAKFSIGLLKLRAWIDILDILIRMVGQSICQRMQRVVEVNAS